MELHVSDGHNCRLRIVGVPSMSQYGTMSDSSSSMTFLIPLRFTRYSRLAAGFKLMI